VSWVKYDTYVPSGRYRIYVNLKSSAFNSGESTETWVYIDNQFVGSITSYRGNFQKIGIDGPFLDAGMHEFKLLFKKENRKSGDSNVRWDYIQLVDVGAESDSSVPDAEGVPDNDWDRDNLDNLQEARIWELKLNGNPTVPNIFVELDWWEGHTPDYVALTRANNAYAERSVSLTIDTGQYGGGEELAHINPIEPDEGTADNWGPMSADHLVDYDKSWTVNQWMGETIEIIAGTGSGEKRIIKSNTETVINFKEDLWVRDDSQYQIADPDEVSLASGIKWYRDNNYFANERRNVFHYAVVSHAIPGGAAGYAYPGDTRFVLAGSTLGSTDFWTHVFMQELGHNILGELWTTPDDPDDHQSECMVDEDNNDKYHSRFSDDNLYVSSSCEYGPAENWNFNKKIWNEMLTEGVGWVDEYT